MNAAMTNIPVPTVITNELLIDLIIKQGPQDQAGVFFQEDLKLSKIEDIRIEHCNILHISNLWPMKNLTKLSLCNNIIEKIEHLNELVNLKELDLSFNHIEIIENLDDLVNIEILSFYSNKISELRGIDKLKKLQIFSIGKNQFNDLNHVLYLRKFKLLRSLNTSGNPCTEQEDYFDYVIARIPQLIYFSYKMIAEEGRKKALEKYDREIATLEDKEAIENEQLNAQKELENKLKVLSEAYVEYLDEDYLFEEMFANDKEGTFFRKMSSDIESANENYKTIFCNISTELVNIGLEEQDKRFQELMMFYSTIDKEKTKVAEKARQSIDFISEKKANYFSEINDMLNKLIKETDENILNEALKKTEIDTNEIISFASEEWNNLMKEEIILHQQILDTLELLKANMTGMVNHFIEISRGHFAQLRNAEVEYNSNLIKLTNRFVNNFGQDQNMPDYLAEFCGDKDILNNNISTTHDVHLQVIDNREDSLINNINTWLNNLTEKSMTDEIRRYKNRILELSHSLDFQDVEFEKTTKEMYHNLNSILSTIYDLFDGNKLVNLVFLND